MSLTRKVFDDTLPNATSPYRIEPAPTGYLLKNDGRTVTITLTELPPRILAGLTLPRMQVTLDFYQHTASEADQFMQRFRRYFHRGGG